MCRHHTSSHQHLFSTHNAIRVECSPSILCTYSANDRTTSTRVFRARVRLSIRTNARHTRTAYITSFTMLPGHRGKGKCTETFAKRLHDLNTRGVDIITLSISSDTPRKHAPAISTPRNGPATIWSTPIWKSNAPTIPGWCSHARTCIRSADLWPRLAALQ